MLLKSIETIRIIRDQDVRLDFHATPEFYHFFSLVPFKYQEVKQMSP